MLCRPRTLAIRSSWAVCRGSVSAWSLCLPLRLLSSSPAARTAPLLFQAGRTSLRSSDPSVLRPTAQETLTAADCFPDSVVPQRVGGDPQKLGHSDEDVFGEVDALMATERAAKRQRDAMTSSSTTESSQKANASSSSSSSSSSLPSAAASPGAKGGDSDTGAGAAVGSETDISEVTRKQRSRRRRRNVDSILGDVLHDALKLRDMGHKPTADFVYKRSQERLYEAEYGRKPPSVKEHAMKYVPFPPDFGLHRLLPFETQTSGPMDLYAKNYMHTYRFLPEDPWPQRAVTAANPVWTKRMVEEDKQKTNGSGLKSWEERMFKPREGFDVADEFCDAMDELAYWEARLLTFLRDCPLSQRRSLPYLHEFYRLFVHRTIRAERRFIEVRNAALVAFFKVSPSTSGTYPPGTEERAQAAQEAVDGDGQQHAAASSSSAVLAATAAPGAKNFFNRTEQSVERIRAICAEAHRSLSSPNYDPLRMKKSALAPFMRMSEGEFTEWQQTERQRRNSVIADLL